MRYLVAETQKNEISGRREYLFDIFNLFFVPYNKVDGFIPLVPLGTAELPVLFLIGHYDQVAEFLEKNIEEIEEKIIVLVTCFAKKMKKYKRYKQQWFVSLSKEEMSSCYYGANYGFNFNITESELNFYNSKEKDILKRIRQNFKVL